MLARASIDAASFRGGMAFALVRIPACCRDGSVGVRDVLNQSPTPVCCPRISRWERGMTGRADEWIRRTTIGCVAVLALIAGTVSYLHMHLLVELHGQPGWVAALTPLSVDGMIVAASTTLLADSRAGGRGGFLPSALLAAGSAARLAAKSRSRSRRSRAA